ncbi:portal protein [Gordonia phage GMA6]|uniref:Portal protein n=1 Tax=Gordonia phage GMA6 TaxID=1647285 RepID=A0A0K0NL63_9CAUD|nr:portal protein [Gordonia phage GMA6]AKL88292.1 hypothetical protein GMA6_11 [Gordonia phage GMA6]
MAGRFLNGLFERKGNSPNEATARAGGPALATSGMPLSGTTGQWDMDQAVNRGLERVGMVFRCVDAIAQTQARIPMQLTRMNPGAARGDADVVEDIDIWKLLNFRSNPYETSTQLRYRISATLLLSRRGAFIEMVPGKDGKVAELHLLLPGSVMPIPDPKRFVSGYQIMRGDSVIDELPPERVCWIKAKPHPTDPYSQLTPLMAAGLSVETDLLARTFNRNFLANDGRPGMLVTIQGQLNREDADEIKSRFSGGYSQAGRTSVIEADGIDVADLAVSPRDLQWSELIKGSKEDIQLAFGVPESVMGNASGRTFDNADAERENFYIDTIQTHCEPIAMGLDAITGDRNDDVVVTYDFSGVDVLQRVAARKREEYRSEFAAGLITIDEYRELSGRTIFDVVGSRVLFTSAGLAIAKTPEDQAGIMKYQQVGTSPGEGLQGAAAAESGALKGVRKGIQEGDRQRGNTQAATAIRQRAMQLSKSFGDDLERKDIETVQKTGEAIEMEHPYLITRYKMEGFLEGQLVQWDSRQEDVVADRLNHVKFRKGTRHWEEKGGDKFPKSEKCKYCKEPATKRIIHSEGRAYVPVCGDHLSKGKEAAASSTPPGSGPDPSNIDRIDDVKSGAYDDREVKALNPSYAINEAKWTQDLVDGLGDFVRKAMLREARRVAGELKGLGLEDVTDMELSGRDPLVSLIGSKSAVEAALDPAYGEVMNIVRGAAKNQSARLKKSIADMDEAGASIKQIEAKVRQMTGGRAPWRKQLAINVTTAAVESARALVYEQAPRGTFVKEWVSEHDDRVRPSHVKADGQRKPAHLPFNVGGSQLQYPCDMSGPVHEVANCRCYATYSLSPKAEQALEAIR